MREKKKSIFNVSLAIFIVVYLISPYYFYICGMKFKYLWSVLGSLLLIVLSKKIPVIKEGINRIELILIINIVVNFLIYVIDKEVLSGLFFVFDSFIAGSIIYKSIDSKEKFLYIIDVIIYISTFVSVLGIVEEVFNYNVFSIFNNINIELNYNPLRFGIKRIISFHAHSIVYCLWIMFILSLNYYRISNKEDKKTIYYISYILLFINAILTLSRSSLVVLLLSQMMLLYFSGVKLFIKKIAQITIVLFIVVLFSTFFTNVIKDTIINSFGMFLAIFNDDYANQISNSFGNDNLKGVGNRIDLYSWVSKEMNGKWALGQGVFTDFSYKYKNRDGYWTEKNSIEVQYLNTLYHKGIIGLAVEVLLYFELLRCSFVLRKNKKTFENKLSFNEVFNTVLFCYVLSFFAVNSSTERPVFCIYIMLLLAYNKLEEGKIYEKQI